jgi:hypothetical protein
MSTIRECPPAGVGGRGNDAPAVGVRERPILFSGPMVQAILAGTKAHTRRVVKVTRRTEWLLRGDWADSFITNPGNKLLDECPYGTKGDRLWVRETWGWRGSWWTVGEPTIRVFVHYRADDTKREILRPHDDDSGLPRQRRRRDGEGEEEWGEYLERWWKLWRPSLLMPRWASRITLEITEVRVQRLQEISEADAIAEGCRAVSMHSLDCDSIPPSRELAALWDSTNGAGSWSSNPWVWAISFRRVTP